MLVLERGTGAIHHDVISNLPRWLRRGDLIVANNTRVFRARLKGRKRDTGGGVELLLLRQLVNDRWTALAKPARRLRPGTVIVVEPRETVIAEPVEIEVVETKRDGEVVLRALGLMVEGLDAYGSMPLPPYISAPLTDDARYQTLHASVAGSAAAPTAGLHITPALRQALSEASVEWAEVTLHVGLDTFRPVAVEDLADHRMHQEWYSVPAETVRAIARTRERGGRIVAVGTTSARTLETIGRRRERLDEFDIEGMTDLFIRPGHRWSLVDAMITNFHLPKSTLLVMISALAGREAVLNAYHVAIAEEYRFFSFGDAMLII
jgi:S-adenosylmethionine:tRNA ribosyltransferase-isomerase